MYCLERCSAESDVLLSDALLSDALLRVMYCSVLRLIYWSVMNCWEWCTAESDVLLGVMYCWEWYTAGSDVLLSDAMLREMYCWVNHCWEWYTAGSIHCWDVTAERIHGWDWRNELAKSIEYCSWERYLAGCVQRTGIIRKLNSWCAPRTYKWRDERGAARPTWSWSYQGQRSRGTGGHRRAAARGTNWKTPDTKLSNKISEKN